MTGTSIAGPSPEPARPTARAAAPFVLLAVIGIICAFLPPYSAYGRGPLVSVAVFVLALGAGTVSLRRSRRTWVDPVGPWLFFLCVVLLRDASGGGLSGLAPLVALPIFWLAIFGTRSDLVVAAGLTLLTFLLPVVVIGGAAYPVSDWRRAVLWTAVTLLIAPVVQRIVRQLAVQTRREREASAQVRGIMRGATLTSLVSTDVEGTITSFSVGAEQLLGYSEDELVGRHDPGVFHDPAEVAQVAAELGLEPGFGMFAELARVRSPSRIWTYVCKDGVRLFVRLAVTELRDDDGDLVGYLGVAVDSTAAVETQQTLMRTEERWRVVMDHLPDTTVLLMDEDMRIDLTAGAGAMGQGFGNVTGKNLSEVSKPENVRIIEPLVRAALRGEEGRAEFSSSATGAEHEVLVSPLPTYDATTRHALIMARDVSRDRAREREVIAARDRAERLFVDAPHAIAVLGLDGVVERVNPALCALFGRVEEQLVGRSLAELGGPEDQTFAKHLHELVTSPSGRSQREWTVHSPDDGGSTHVVLSSTVLKGESEEKDQVLVNVMDVSERHNYEQQLAHLADHDPLTGLANRRRFSAELGRHLEFCRRYGARGAVLLLDLDHFKEVNDALGHSAGDQLIVSISGLLRHAVRETDVVARLGGDEFAVLLQETERAGAELVAETIVSTIRNHVRTLDGTRRNVTASVGVVLVDERNYSPSDLLAAADMTMYDAKDAGRDRWAILDHDLFDQPRGGARLAWNARIEKAVENDDLTLHLQPILDVERGVVTGAEALLRLSDGPELVYPARFLYVAERTGLIRRVDQWVLNHAIELLEQLQELQPDFRLEVNVSGRSIGDPDLEKSLVEALRRHDVDPRGLVLEITETAAVADVQAARAFAERVTALGCSFALDDFGAGFGSFYYLKHLLFDYVKIDGEFVANCHVNPTDRAIVQSIVGITHGLGKRAIAEFVSEAAILDVMREEGVDFVQGYHVGRPTSVDEFVASFLARRDGEPIAG